MPDYSLQRLDYDTIAHLYDAPDRAKTVDAHLSACISAHADATAFRALDIGCGTGLQVAANRQAHPGIVGADLFIGMLRVGSRHDPSAPFVQTDATCTAFRDASFDYVSNQFSYAHILDKPAFAAEMERILRPDGRLVVVNIDPWSMEDWMIYRFFPEAREVDEKDFLPEETFVRILEGAGFAVRADRRDVSRDERLGDFLDYASERHRASQFLAITDEAYDAGVGRVRDAVAEHGADATMRSELCLLTLIAEKRK